MKKTIKFMLMIIFSAIMLAITVISPSAASLTGDLDGDGEITVRDAAIILQIVTGHTDIEIVEPCYHKGTVVIDEAVPASCTIDGKTTGVHCTACNEILLEQITIPPPDTKKLSFPAHLQAAPKTVLPMANTVRFARKP